MLLYRICWIESFHIHYAYILKGKAIKSLEYEELFVALLELLKLWVLIFSSSKLNFLSNSSAEINKL